MGVLVAAAVSLGAHADPAPFTPGAGYAAGRTVALVDVYGGARLGFNVDEASAEYQDGTGAATGAPLDSGFTTLLSELQTCGVYAFPPSLVPPVTQVSTNSTHNRAPVTATNKGASTAPLAAVSVSARPDADGRSDVTSGSAGVPGLVALTGGSTHTEATSNPAASKRTVVADVRDGDVSLLGGLVHLRGLHWNATVTITGADSRDDHSTATPTFEVGSVSIGPATVPLKQADESSVNRLLAPLGLQLHLPTISRPTPKELTIGPLTVAIGGRTAIGPVLAAALGGTTLPKIEDALKPGVFDPTTCKELGGLLASVKPVNAEWNLLGAGYPIIVAAAVGTLDGGGELDVNLGGVTATLDDAYYPVHAFGAPQFETSTFGSPPVVVAHPGSTPSTNPAETAPATQSVITKTVKTSARCTTTSSVGSPRCWGGHAAAAGLTATTLTLTLFAADEATRRRRRRKRGHAITI